MIEAGALVLPEPGDAPAEPATIRLPAARPRARLAVRIAAAATLLIGLVWLLSDSGGGGRLALARRDLEAGRHAEAFDQAAKLLDNGVALPAGQRAEAVRILEESAYRMARKALVAGGFEEVRHIARRAARRSARSARLVNVRIQAERGERSETSLGGRGSLLRDFGYEPGGHALMKDSSLPEATPKAERIRRELADGAILGLAGGTARLRGAELGMGGVSGRADPVAEGGDPAEPPELQPVSIAANGRHPLADPSFPYRVEIYVERGGRLYNRRLTFEGNQCRVRLQKGDVFRIRIANRTRRDVFVRALVDGLNTLPERSQVKGVYVEARKGPYRQAQPVNLIEARAWLVRAGDRNDIAGFFIKTGENAEYDKFKVTDAAQAFAVKAGFPDQLGLITVGFFELQKKPPPGPPGARATVGVGSGGRYHTQTELYDGPFIPGRMLGVVHIRYGQ